MIVSVIYQLSEGQKFDLDYYMKTHTPLVRSRFGPCGMKSIEVLHGTGSPSGPAAAKVIALLDFDSADSFQKALTQHGAEVLGDIAKFTDNQPSIQFNEKLN